MSVLIGSACQGRPQFDSTNEEDENTEHGRAVWRSSSVISSGGNARKSDFTRGPILMRHRRAQPVPQHVSEAEWGTTFDQPHSLQLSLARMATDARTRPTQPPRNRPVANALIPQAFLQPSSRHGDAERACISVLAQLLPWNIVVVESAPVVTRKDLFACTEGFQ